MILEHFIHLLRNREDFRFNSLRETSRHQKDRRISMLYTADPLPFDDYHRTRARAERHAAAQATTPRARQAHLELAARHDAACEDWRARPAGASIERALLGDALRAAIPVTPPPERAAEDQANSSPANVPAARQSARMRKNAGDPLP